MKILSKICLPSVARQYSPEYSLEFFFFNITNNNAVNICVCVVFAWMSLKIHCEKRIAGSREMFILNLIDIAKSLPQTSPYIYQACQYQIIMICLQCCQSVVEKLIPRC